MNKDHIPQDGELMDEQAVNELEETELPDSAELENTEQADEVDELFAQMDSEEANETEEANDSAESEETDDKDGDNKPKRKAKVKKDRRKLRYGGMSAGLTAAVVAVFVVFNVIAGILYDRFPLSVDLTKENLYTLSDESKDMAKAIKQDVEIVVFGEESMFSSPSVGTEEINTVLKQVHEFGEMYQTISGGKIKIKYVDLTKDPTQEAKYSSYEVEGGDILFICDKRSQKANLQSLFSYDEQTYMYYQQYADVKSLVEQVFTTKISMVAGGNAPIATILTGHEEDTSTVSSLKSMFAEQGFITEELNFTGSNTFNKDSTLAIIAAPAKDYSEDEVKRLSSWLKNDSKYGRNVFVLVNYAAECPNLYEFLNVEYGIEVTNNLVVETDNDNIFQSQKFYPYANIGSSDFTKDLDGKRVLLPGVRQILTNKENSTNNSIYNVDIVTLPESARLIDLKEFLAQTDASKELTEKKASEYPVIAMAYATAWAYDNESSETVSSNVLVSGSFMMVNDQVMSMATVYNKQTIMGLLNGFTGNTNTVTVASQSLEQEALEFTTAQENLYWFVFVLFIPVALLVTCLVVFLRRRRL